MRTTTIFAVLSLAAAPAPRILAGPLNPPPGPVAPTGRFGPRIEINATNTPGNADSVYKITAPGSYYLAQDVTGIAFRHGIEIDSAGVSLDLGGFNVNGVANSLDGIHVSAAIAGSISIRNGFLGNWGGAGINAAGSIDFRVEEITVNFGLGDGIVLGQNALITNCLAQFVDSGFVAGDGASFENCTASVCNINGFEAGLGSRLTDCSASGCLNIGIRAGGRSVITGCVASDNDDVGINAGARSVVSICQARGNRIGILTGIGCVIEACVATESTSDGIVIGDNSTIVHCSSSQNERHGIVATAGCHIRANTCNGNGTIDLGAGILVNTDSTRIESNSAIGNDIGVRVGGSGNVIAGNQAVDNDIGLEVTNFVNLVHGNMARANASDNYQIVANNRVGIIVVPPLSGVVTANAGAAGLGTTNPWVNYAY